MANYYTSNMYLGADNSGIKSGIHYLKKRGIIKDSKNIYFNSLNSQVKNKRMKYLPEITKHLKNIYYALEVNKNFDCNILIGGDHSISLASVSHSVDNIEDLAVIWIDAHADINTEITTNSGNLHGMSVSALLGLGNPEWVYFKERATFLKPKNIIYIGLRDIEPDEFLLLKKLGIKFYSYDIITKFGLDILLDTIINDLKANNIKNLHISYDLDSADPNIAPGVSTPVENGLSFNETIYLFKNLQQKFTLRALDIVEFNPQNDVEDKTANLIKEILNCIE